MERVLVVSSDCHAGIPLASYRPYLERAYHEDFDDYAASLRRLYETNDIYADEIKEERTEVARRARFTDPVGRLEDLEGEGVVSEVLFPGASPDTAAPWSDFLSLGVFRARTPEQRRFQAAGERAYNRWIAEFCQAAPRHRRVGLAFVPFHDVERAVEEIVWAADNGLRGVLMPFFQYDVPEYCQGSHWDRIWAVCAETGLSLNFHGGYGQPECGPYAALASLEHPYFSTRPIAQLVLSCVFDRFPDLRLAITESRAGWVPKLMAELDASVDRYRSASANEVTVYTYDNLPRRKPSEYWFDNCFVGASVTVLAEMQDRHAIGVGTMMHGIDYPHPEGSWGNATTWMQASLGRAGVPPDEARLILGENAVRLYGLDLESLREVASRVGPRMEDVLAVADHETIDALLEEVSASGRRLSADLYARPKPGD